jgi:hypothetical protein
LLDPIVDLVIKSKIITKLIHKCIEISVIYLVNKDEIITTWKFDLKKKSEIAMWFASEAEEVIHYN